MQILRAGGWLSACLVSLAITHAGEPDSAESRSQSPAARPESPVPGDSLKSAERIVFVGSTFVERWQRFGYLETELLRRFPQHDLSVRNLGWSGDTVFAESRGIFDPPAVGYQRMLEQIRGLRPTRIIIGYGANEAFGGSEQLEPFLQQLATLLQDLQSTRAVFQLMTPHLFEQMPPPLPDSAAHNLDVQQYGRAVLEFAQARGLACADLRDLLIDAVSSELREVMRDQQWHLTNNGQHLNELGYWYAAPVIIDRLLPDSKPQAWSVVIRAASDDRSSPTANVSGTQISELTRQDRQIRFRLLDETLPPAAFPDLSASSRTLQITGLPAGKYELSVDGRVLRSGTAEAWQTGLKLTAGPEFEQIAQLREAVIEKNRLYFHRWRPQNVTYLFGFRKHEQGQNAAEVAEFDTLVAEKETEIRKLSRPRPHQYVLSRVGD